MTTKPGTRTDHPLPQSQPRFLGLPRSQAGRWSLWLLAGALLCFLMMQALVMTGQRGGDTFFDNLWLSLPALVALLLLLSAAILAAVAIFRLRERSLFSFLGLIFGLLISLFLVFEITVPH